MIPLPPSVTLQSAPGKLDRIVISTPVATAHVYLHGAHVSHYQRASQPPLLFMSAASLFQENKPIRGGVPICFPWFGARLNRPDSPAHGFARLLPWQLVAATELADGEVMVELSLKDSEGTRAIWAHRFELLYTVTVGQVLTMRLTVKNTGDVPMRFEEALHTYFHVGDIHRVSVTGLENTRYFSKVNNEGFRTSAQAPISFSAETDRVYLGTRSACVIDDPVLGRKIHVAKSDSDATVVWNPWIAKAKAMADFGDEEWPSMICIETANVLEHPITLRPGDAHAMSQEVR